MRPTYNQLRNASRLDLGRSFPLKAPLALYVEPANVCNFRCVLCPESFPDYREQAGYYSRMPLDLFKKVVLDLQEARFREIHSKGAGEIGVQRLHVSGRRNEIPACAQCDALYTSRDFVHLSAAEFEKRSSASAVECTV